MVDVIRATSILHRQRPNLLLNPNKFDATWSGTAGVAQSASVGPFGSELAWDITDNSAVAFQSLVQAVTVLRDYRSYTYSIFVKKTTGETAPDFGCSWMFTGGVVISNSANTPRLNTDTGEVFGGPVVEDYDTYWRIWNVIQNSGSNTALSFTIFPATRDHGGASDSSAAIGTATVYGAMVNVGVRPAPYIQAA
jgi:hypothetical protein